MDPPTPKDSFVVAPLRLSELPNRKSEKSGEDSGSSEIKYNTVSAQKPLRPMLGDKFGAHFPRAAAPCTRPIDNSSLPQMDGSRHRIRRRRRDSRKEPARISSLSFFFLRKI
ncbi:hypothetical protein CEXT_194481 [Caerostris extrusa]|uniref:Uncharacterized protein n=1 Tax=Caerostris extrusa TaxID=172846 RepID=A0AAV4MMD1_CAEEX|nr:hypothetical protein CEXT_194481 [Caerostris extrusa]